MWPLLCGGGTHSHNKLIVDHGGDGEADASTEIVPLLTGCTFWDFLVGPVPKGPHIRRLAARHLRLLCLSGCGISGFVPA